jgi:hypothetical protein
MNDLDPYRRASQELAALSGISQDDEVRRTSKSLAEAFDAVLASSKITRVETKLLRKPEFGIDGLPIYDDVEYIRTVQVTEDYLRTIEKQLEQLTEAGAKYAESIGKDRYQSGVFQCLGDYETCRRTQNKAICLAFAAVCVASKLIPLAKS